MSVLASKSKNAVCVKQIKGADACLVSASPALARWMVRHMAAPTSGSPVPIGYCTFDTKVVMPLATYPNLPKVPLPIRGAAEHHYLYGQSSQKVIEMNLDQANPFA